MLAGLVLYMARHFAAASAVSRSGDWRSTGHGSPQLGRSASHCFFVFLCITVAKVAPVMRDLLECA